MKETDPSYLQDLFVTQQIRHALSVVGLSSSQYLHRIHWNWETFPVRSVIAFAHAGYVDNEIHYFFSLERAYLHGKDYTTLDSVVMHEIAHIIVFILNPNRSPCDENYVPEENQGHGPEWISIMKELGQRPSRFVNIREPEEIKTRSRGSLSLGEGILHRNGGFEFKMSPMTREEEYKNALSRAKSWLLKKTKFKR